jgi:uncharacterized protein YybS (DUF2232 family)
LSRPRVNPRPLTEGALFAGLAVVLALIGFFVPVIGIFVSFLWPVPIALMVVRHGVRTAILTVVVAGIVLSMVIGILEGAVMSLTLGVVGLAIGYAILRGWNAISTILAASLAVMVGLAVTLAVSVAFLKLDALTLLAPDMSEAAKQVSDLYQKFGIPKETTAQVMKMVLPPRDLLLATLPAGILMAVLINALINFEVSRRIMPRFGYKVPGLPAFRDWRFPRYFALVFIVAQVIGALKGAPPVEVWGRAFNIGHSSELLAKAMFNISMPLSIWMMLQGLSIGYFFLSRFKLSRVWTNLLVMFVMFNPGLWQIALIFGLMDNVFDYRRLVTARQS